MDKLKKVLSGQDGNDDVNVLQAANEASTLGWGTRVKGFVACFVAGVLCSVLVRLQHAKRVVYVHPIYTFLYLYECFLGLYARCADRSLLHHTTARAIRNDAFSRYCNVIRPAQHRMNKNTSVVLTVTSVIQGTCLLWVPRNGLTLFAVFYSLGNISSLLSTMFLMGPLKQIKRMCDKTRALATAIMITCLILTFCAAFWWKNKGLALLFCVLQFLAFAWYSLSYIPFARDAIIKLFSACFN